MGLLRTLFLGDLGNYLDNEDLKTEHEMTRRRLRRKESKDRSQDRMIADLERENVELKYALSALVKCLHRKELLTTDELVRISDLEKDLEGGKEDPGELWDRFNRERT